MVFSDAASIISFVKNDSRAVAWHWSLDKLGDFAGFVCYSLVDIY
jgi:hypothetical protein